MHYQHYKSPIGSLTLAGDEQALHALLLPGDNIQRLWPEATSADAPFIQVRQQLDEYFAGNRRHFDLPLALSGTAFQLQVWHALQRLDYGQTCSYQQLALAIDNPRAVRAVGRANGANPIAIIVPCHRVIGHGGALTGYAGGIERKQWLLRHEGVRLDSGQVELAL